MKFWRRRKRRNQGEVTFGLTKVPKSYDDMTPEERWEWAGELLQGLKPRDHESEGGS